MLRQREILINSAARCTLCRSANSTKSGAMVGVCQRRFDTGRIFRLYIWHVDFIIDHPRNLLLESVKMREQIKSFEHYSRAVKGSTLLFKLLRVIVVLMRQRVRANKNWLVSNNY